MSIDKKDIPVESFKETLSFYGVELQSHAAMILGLALLIFAIVQAWGQLAVTGKLNSYHAPMFSFLVGVMGAGILYQLWRLYAYGKFASALLYSSDAAFNAAKDEWDTRYEKNPKAQWEHLLPLAQISVFAEQMLRLNANKLWFKLRVFHEVDKRVRLSPWVLVVAFEASFALSYSLIFGTVDWYLPEFMSSSIFIILFGYYFVWRRKLQPSSKIGHTTNGSS